MAVLACLALAAGPATASAAAPNITSADNATFTTGSLGTFAVTADDPASILTWTGALPLGVTFVDNLNGTATLAGTPLAGTGGAYPITITAANGTAPDAQQSFTLTVDEPPALTSADHATFTTATPGTFTVSSTGFPVAALTETGALPAGVQLVDNGDGTAKLAGTPPAGSAGAYPITISAHNGVAPDLPQAFTLTVVDPPAPPAPSQPPEPPPAPTVVPLPPAAPPPATLFGSDALIRDLLGRFAGDQVNWFGRGGFRSLTQSRTVSSAIGGLLQEKAYLGSPSLTGLLRAQAASRKRTGAILVARGSRAFAQPGSGALKLKLTHAGKTALAHAKSLNITFVIRFLPAGGGRPVGEAITMKIRAGRRRH